jgi:hypothetical protein
LGGLFFEDEGTGDDVVGAGGVEEGDCFAADATVGLDVDAKVALGDELAGAADFFWNGWVHGCAFDSDFGAHDGEEVEGVPVGFEEVEGFVDAEGNAGIFFGGVDGLEDWHNGRSATAATSAGGAIFERIQADDESIGSGFDEGVDPTERIGDHEMNFERKFCMRADGFYLVGKEKKIVDVMTVGDIDVKAIGVGFDAANFGGEIGEVSGPEGGGALKHEEQFNSLSKAALTSYPRAILFRCLRCW